MIYEIMDMFGVSESRVKSKVKYLKDYYKTDEEIFAYFEKNKAAGISFYNIKSDIKIINEKKESDNIISQFVIDELTLTIEMNIQEILKAVDYCPLTKINYKKLKTFCYETQRSVKDVQNMILNSHTKEFLIDENSRVTLNNKDKYISILENNLKQYDWLRLSEILFKRYLSNKRWVLRKAIIDFFLDENGFFIKESFQFTLINLISDTEKLREIIIKALTQENDSYKYFEKILKRGKR
jgi:hypothetical protein